jgi:Coenzyme PQQ synthesis protein D (PqqD)
MNSASPSEMGADVVVRSNPDIPSSRLDDDLLAIDERGGYCYSMNGSAARIWELIATPKAVGDVCTALCQEFVVDRETCLRDLSGILSAMSEAGLVDIVDAPVD